MHFPTRDALLDAVPDRATAEVLDVIEAAEPQRGHPVDAPAPRGDGRVAEPGAATLVTVNARRPEAEPHRRHRPLHTALEPLIERGQRDGAFRADVPAVWHCRRIGADAPEITARFRDPAGNVLGLYQEPDDGTSSDDLTSETRMLANRSMPTCTVIPELVYEDVGRASEWLCKTFGFEERLRAGGHRAQLSVGDGAVVLTEARVGQGFSSPDSAEFRPPRRGEVSSSVTVRVQDADHHHERARQRGAWILQPPTDYPYGERQYTAEDLAGHRWSFSESIADVAPKEWGGDSGESQFRASPG